MVNLHNPLTVYAPGIFDTTLCLGVFEVNEVLRLQTLFELVSSAFHGALYRDEDFFVKWLEGNVYTEHTSLVYHEVHALEVELEHVAVEGIPKTQKSSKCLDTKHIDVLRGARYDLIEL